MTPCESNPLRLASTRLRATTVDSSAGPPAALNTASAKENKRSAAIVGTRTNSELAKPTIRIQCPDAGDNMTYHIRSEERPNSMGLDRAVYVLSSSDASAEIWPALGFNCFRWQMTWNG